MEILANIDTKGQLGGEILVHKDDDMLFNCQDFFFDLLED